VFGVGVDGFDSGEEVSGVSLHEDGILSKVDVLVVCFEVGFEERVVFGEGVEDETGDAKERERRERVSLGIGTRREQGGGYRGIAKK